MGTVVTSPEYYCAGLNHHVRSPFALLFSAELLYLMERRPATPGAYLNTSSNAAMELRYSRSLCGLFRAVSAPAVDLRFIDQEGEKRGFAGGFIAFLAN